MKNVSLVEMKKQQWAKEREEMSRLYVPWGGRGKHSTSSLDLHRYSGSNERQRSPSLPPIGTQEDSRRSSREVLNRNVSVDKRFFYDEEVEGDTSGYGSETHHLNGRGKMDSMTDSHNPVAAWQAGIPEHNRSSERSSPPEHGPWSLSSRQGGSGGEEGRMKWGDRGVATGRLWEPQDASARLPQMQIQRKGTPAWVERGLNMLDSSAEVLVIDQQSNHSGGTECDRSSCNGSDAGRNTFLRGQNVPIEPEVKALREHKRMKAMELQSAIKNQLEEREKQRQEEREKRLKEERLEELRIQRQQEEDQRKLSEERRKKEEKREAEQKKMDALKKAIADAEKQAKIEKEQMFSIHKPQIESYAHDDTHSLKSINIEGDKTSLSLQFSESFQETKETSEISSKKSSPRKHYSTRTFDLNSSKSNESINKDSGINSHIQSPRSSAGNIKQYMHTVPSIPLYDTPVGILPIGIAPDIITPIATNGIQLAVILPQNSNNVYNLAQPLSLQLNSLLNVDESTQSTKLLTPRKYRSLKCKDASTQTDPQKQYKNTDEPEKNTRNYDKEYPNIDENAPQDGYKSKKERRFRSEERYKKELENRPKWGVNRPAAQYKKQSEKDPFYGQKRKIRQKYRAQARQYLSQSSDDSRSPSPLTHSENLSENRSRTSISQSHWRTKRASQELFRPNSMSVETVNITPLEYNHLGQVTLGDEITDNSRSTSSKMSSTKRITLSQKFINDKYGNRKMWNEMPNIDKNFKFSVIDVENGKDKGKIWDTSNTAKKDVNDNKSDLDLPLHKSTLQN